MQIDLDSKVAGNYDLGKTIGKGHFAVVKLARHAFTGECVAVKIIDKTKLDGISRDHLFQEVMCMKLVQHPHVVRLYEVIDTTHKLYLIQEWGDGGDLYDYIMRHDKGLTEHNARKYFGQILNAIAYCHKLHVVHRDLKPENVVFFEKSGIVKLTDFGFSNKFTPGTLLETSCGSLAYSAPEILLGDSYDPPKIDIWSLGVILYMLVCGVLPFQEANDSETLTKIMDCHYSLPNCLSLSCCNLIRKMLCRDPDQRANLNDILTDPWVCEEEKENQAIESSCSNSSRASSGPGCQCADPGQCCPLPLICQHQLDYEEHMEILNLMADGQVGSQADIQNALDSNQYNHLTATYFLLAERKLKRRHAMFLSEFSVITGDTGSNGSHITARSDLSHANTMSGIPPTIVVPAVSAIRILNNEAIGGTPEERLRRFSMILEDEEEKDDENEVDEEEENVIRLEDVMEGEPLDNTGFVGQFSNSSGRRSSRQVSIVPHAGRSLSLSVTKELGEELLIDDDGVAVLRFSASLARCTSSKSNSRRHSQLSHVLSLPQLWFDTSEEVNSVSQVSPRSRKTATVDYKEAASVKNSLVNRRRSATTCSISSRQRRSLPSPPTHRIRRPLLGQSKALSMSYSNSCDNSDTEGSHTEIQPFVLPVCNNNCATHSTSPSFKCQSLPYRPRSNNTQSSSRSSSGNNLREHCAPIKEVDEASANTFHHSLSMVASPSVAVWSPQHNVARHSVHGITAYKPVMGNTGSSVSQSNFSLSSLASSLRDSKLMMEVIRGTFELQLHQRGSKGPNSISSSVSHQDRLDQINEDTRATKLSTMGAGRSATHSGIIMTINEVVNDGPMSDTNTPNEDNSREFVPSNKLLSVAETAAEVLVSNDNVVEKRDRSQLQSHRQKLPFKVHCCVLS